MRRDVKCLGPHVDDLESVHTGNNKEDTGTASPASQEATHPEYDGPLELLDHLGTNQRPGLLTNERTELTFTTNMRLRGSVTRIRMTATMVSSLVQATGPRLSSPEGDIW